MPASPGNPIPRRLPADALPAVLAVALAMVLAALGGCSPAPSPVEPVAGFEASDLSGPGPWTHEIEIGAGAGPVLLRLEQRGADLRLSAVTPEGELGPVDNGFWRNEDEILLLEGVSGPVELKISATTDHAPSFGYRLVAERLPADNETDRLRIAAHRLLSEGGMRLATGEDADREMAGEKLAEAIGLLEDTPLARDRARVRLIHAWLRYVWFYRWEEAEELAVQAEADLASLAEPVALADAVSVQAMAAMEQPDRRQAEALIREARRLQRTAGQHHDAAFMTNNLGLLRFYQERWEEAAALFGRARASFQSLGEVARARQAQGNAATAAHYQGDHARAAAELATVAETFLAEGDTRSGADFLSNAAWSRAELGELDQARGLYRRAHDLFRSIGADGGRLRAMRGLAYTYLQAGAEDRALGILRDSYRESGEHAEADAAFTHLALMGVLERRAGRYEEALDLHRRLLERVDTARREARARMEIGLDLAASGRTDGAVAELERATALVAGMGGDVMRARTRAALGRVLAESDPERARRVLQSAMEDARASLDLPTRIAALQGLVDAAAREGDVDAALEHSRAALAALGDQRAHMAGPQLRWSFSGVERPTHSEHVALLITLAERAEGEARTDYLWEALAAADRSRARTLAEMTSIVGGPGGEAARHRRRLAELEFQADRKREQGEALGTGLRAALRRERLALDAAWEGLELPVSEEAFDPESLRAQFAAGGSPVAAVVYHLAEPESFAWVVSTSGIAVHRLPSRARLEALARRLHDTLARRTVGAGTAPVEALTTALSEALVEGVLDDLPDGVLVVVADGALELVPADVLRTSDSIRLVERFEIVHQPSLAMMARSFDGGGVVRRKDWLGVAMPGRLSADSDPRLAGLPPLLEADEEVASIAALARAADLTAEILPEGAAFRARMAAHAPPARLHIASHGLLDMDDPRLSGLVVPGADGPEILSLWEILEIADGLELVTLSACDAAGGRVLEGEGLFSLAHGFLAGGADAVVASRWQVGDRAARVMMESFYAALFEGERPSRALQSAKLALIREEAAAGLGHPSHWAAFSLHGDWRIGPPGRREGETGAAPDTDALVMTVP